MQSENNFSGGWKAGIDPGRQPVNSLELLQNFRILSTEGSSYAITNLEGHSVVSSLPPNYVPMAVREKNGVAYFVCAEVINGLATGRGELGSFPSPDPDNDEMDLKYRPLQNYGGDNNQSPASMDGAFRSIHFNLSLDREVDLELQDSYDGSINMIFTDGHPNPVWIVNTGFATDGNTYQAIDRQGSKDTNRYSVSNFENTLQLIMRSNEIMQLDFRGAEPGGKLKEGTNFYYFRYATADGNETDVVGESGPVAIFHGDRMQNIRGGEGSSEETNKQARFTLSGLDASYKFVQAYFVYVTGEHEPLRRAYRIEKRYALTGSSLDFVHSGYEPVEEIELEELNLRFSNIGSAGTLTQVQGQLLLGDITERAYAYSPFQKLAQKTGLYAHDAHINVAGSMGLDRLQEPLEQNNKKAGTDGWNLAYANPQNIYHRTAYFDGESYPFGIRFIMPGGHLSPTFPVIAFDDARGDAKKNYTALMSRVGELTEKNNGWLWDGTKLTGVNNKGVYRFPKRFNSFNYAAGTEFLGSDKVKIQGITFRFPAAEDADFQEVKKKSIGCQLMRAARKADLLMQGLIIDAHPVPIEDRAPANEGEANDGWKLWNYNSGNYNDSNSRFVPAFDFITESRMAYATNSNGNHRSHIGEPGLQPIRLNLLNRELHKGKRFALLSHDFMANKTKAMQAVNGRDVLVESVLKTLFRYDVATTTVYQTEGYFSLIRQEKAIKNDEGNRTGRLSWVESGQSSPNTEGFAGAAIYQGKFQDEYGVCPHRYNDYIGLSMDSNRGLLGTPASNTGLESGMKITTSMLGGESAAARIVNIYPSQGPRSFDALASMYSSLEGEIYFPISGRMSWAQLEEAIGGSRELKLYGGDCFTNMGYRRLFINQQEVTTGEETWAHLGYTIGFAQQSSYNIALRGLELFDVLEPGKRTFAPYMTKGHQTGDLFAIGNKWRENRQPESSRLNQGYGVHQGEGRSIPMPMDAPYIESRWPGKVIVSPAYNTSAFENAYRYWAGVSEQDYGTTYGRIVALRSINGRAVAIMERGVGFIGLNERVQTGSDTAGAIFLEASAPLSPQMGMQSTLYGAQRKSAALVTVSGLFGADERNLILWTLDGEGFRQIGRDNAYPYMKRFAGNYRSSKGRGLLKKGVALHWNKEHGEVWFSFYNRIGEAAFMEDSFTLVYNERAKDFDQRLAFLPFMSFSLDDRMISFDVRAEQGKMHQPDESAARNSYNGVTYPSVIRFAVNDQLKYEKLFQVLNISSNAVLPKKVRFETNNTVAELEPKEIPGKLHLSNASYDGGQANIPVPKVSSISGKPAGLLAKAGMKVPQHMLPKSRLRGNYMLVEIEYNETEKIRLYGASVTFQIPETL